MQSNTLSLPPDRESCLRGLAACSWIPKSARDAISLMQNGKYIEAQLLLKETGSAMTSKRNKQCLDMLCLIASMGSDDSTSQELPHFRALCSLCN